MKRYHLYFKKIIQWLDENHNRRFEYNDFKNKNKELFCMQYSFITVHGENVSQIILAGESVNIENIENVNELKTTDLTNTPIVIFINSTNNIENRKHLQSIICRDDININQLFFCINSNLNIVQIKRIIYDLGISNPNIVSGINDKIIEDYFKSYPLTEYIRTFLDVFREKISQIQDILNVENARNQMLNNEVYKKIHRLENDIRLLKEADDLFVQRDRFAPPPEYITAMNDFFSKISNWRNKKTKTTNTDEARKMAEEFNSELDLFYSEFVNEINRVSEQKSEEIDMMFSKWFYDTGVEKDYTPVFDYSYSAKEYITPNLIQIFMNLKTEQYIENKGTIFDLFRANVDNSSKIIEINYVYEAWREEALMEYKNLCQAVIDDWRLTLEKYYSLLAGVYHKHIAALITKKMEEKTVFSGQLSEDGRLLQIDNDWLLSLKDKLHIIERG